MSLIKKIHLTSPYQLNQMAKWAYAMVPVHLRYDRDFFKLSAWLEETQWWPAEKLEEYQNERLRLLIRHAYKNVPYYAQLFQEQGISPSDINTICDLPKIPILTKEILRDNLRNLVATTSDEKDRVYLSTSGTTGQPVGFYSEKKLEYDDGDPFWWRRLRWGGCDLKSRRAALTAWTIQPKRNGMRRIFTYNPVRGLLILSTYDLSRGSCAQYASALCKYKPDFILGFPSALEMMVKYFTDAGITKPGSPRTIFTQSEVLYPWQRDLIQNYFGCQIYDWYGMEERVVCASQCEKQSAYHIFSEFSIVEFVKNQKQVVGEDGQIIATRLENYAMPLIRYQTGDIGIKLKEKCACGRGLPLMNLIGGRDRNFAVTREGGLISITVVDIPKATRNVEQFQFVQKQKGLLTLRIVKKESFSNNDVKLIYKNLHDKFGDMIKVNLEFVESIRRTSRGKLPLLIQHLNIDDQ